MDLICRYAEGTGALRAFCSPSRGSRIPEPNGARGAGVAPGLGGGSCSGDSSRVPVPSREGGGPADGSLWGHPWGCALQHAVPGTSPSPCGSFWGATRGSRQGGRQLPRDQPSLDLIRLNKAAFIHVDLGGVSQPAPAPAEPSCFAGARCMAPGCPGHGTGMSDAWHWDELCLARPLGWVRVHAWCLVPGVGAKIGFLKPQKSPRRCFRS